MLKFEIAVYNEKVRRLDNAGERHRQLSKEWGSTHYFEIEARDEAHAKSEALTKYPVEAGYVIERIAPI